MTTWPRNSRSFTQRRGSRIFESSFATEGASQIQDEQLAVGLRSSAQLKKGKEAEADWIKYRNVVVTRQLSGDQDPADRGPHLH